MSILFPTWGMRLCHRLTEQLLRNRDAVITETADSAGLHIHGNCVRGITVTTLEPGDLSFCVGMGLQGGYAPWKLLRRIA